MKLKNLYKDPELEIIEFKACDVISTSGEGESGGDAGDGGDDGTTLPEIPFW